MDDLLSGFIKKENNLFQSALWEKYQQSLGRKTFWVNCNDDEVLIVKLPLFRNKSYLYCPRAPQTSNEGWHLFVNKTVQIAKEEDCVFVRVEPYAVPNGILKKLGFSKVGKGSPVSKQYSPMDTLLLDLTKTEEELLNEMKPKWRYNIKLAERKGVTVRQSNKQDDLKKFYELSRGMVKRGYHSFEFVHYQKMLENLGKNATLFVAEQEKDILSVLLVTFYDKTATYLHGASADVKRELMPNHLAQWEAIKDAKSRGCEIYDFWGIEPENQENHEWAGISRFKRGFGGEEVHFLGSYDYKFQKIWYNLFYVYNLLRKILPRK
jgi:lipid II:glycine glycyltransferase (peptidoglycan interpeptide bridge formation enzyme)